MRVNGSLAYNSKASLTRASTDNNSYFLINKVYPLLLPPSALCSSPLLSRNPRLLHAMASMLGVPVRLWVRNGTAFEGILRCVSPNIDIVLEVVHKVFLCSFSYMVTMEIMVEIRFDVNPIEIF